MFTIPAPSGIYRTLSYLQLKPQPPSAPQLTLLTFPRPQVFFASSTQSRQDVRVSASSRINVKLYLLAPSNSELTSKVTRTISPEISSILPDLTEGQICFPKTLPSSL